MKTLLSSIVITTLSIGSFAQNVNIPDPNFKALLVGNSAINTNADSEIQVSEAAAFTGDIFGNNLGITDLTGIEAFTSITGLYCRDNNLGSLNISANTALTYVDCQNTNISTLDVSNNTALTGINCSINNLTSLDFSQNTAMTAIICNDNDLTSLNVSNCPSLSNFGCDNNNLTSLDVSNNSALIYFVCHFNELTSLDISACTALSHFSCSGNYLTSLDVSNNLALWNLYCAINNITELDVSANTSLVLLRCEDNDLHMLNVANGNNTNFTMFTAGSNPNLSCIEVDDDVWSAANWTNIDATASFSVDCNYAGLSENNLEHQVSIYPNPATEMITVNSDLEISTIQIFSVLGEIELILDNSATSLDISNLTPGIYFVQIETKSGTVRKQIIKN